jgi:hypothetical protein
MRLQPNETVLVGAWEFTGGRVKADAIEERIELLVSGLLEKVATTADGWEILYRDPEDGRYWELLFPQSEIQGGGPRTLRHVEQSEAQNKYKISTKER